MRRKILKTAAVVMTFVMCLGMTAFAQPSPEAPSFIVSGISKAVDANGNDISKMIEKQALPEEYKAVADELRTEEGLKAVLGSDYNENMVVADVIDVVVKGDIAFPATITFQMKGVTASTKGQILHYNGKEWEKIPTTMGEGTISGTFQSLSPVAFVVDKTTLAGGSTSPKTSAQPVTAVALAGLLAVAAACGMKKRAVER